MLMTPSSASGAAALLQTASARLSGALAVFAGLACISLLLLVCANAGFRAFGLPIRGAVECSGILSALTAALALPFAQKHGDHITGGIAAGRVPAALRRPLHAAVLLASAAFFIICTYEVADIGLFALETGETIDGIGDLYPWMVLLTVPGFACQALMLLFELASLLLTGKE